MPRPRFIPLSSSWVSIHPEAKGVVQFIGSAFFGTFPTVFYRQLLEEFFQAGYTVIALPFRFSFRHWPIATSLLKEQAILRQVLSQEAKRLGFACDIYQEDAYFWVGHSLGCKYIALLEILGDLEGDLRVAEAAVQRCTKQSENQLRQIRESLNYTGNSIKNQPSLLIAPDISDTQSAIPVPVLADLLDRLGLGVLPTREETKCLISNSPLFNLTALVSLREDSIAGSIQDQDVQDSDVLWLYRLLNQRALPFMGIEVPGKHLAPIGIKSNFVLDINPLDVFVSSSERAQLHDAITYYLEQLGQRLKSLTSALEKPGICEQMPGGLPVKSLATQRVTRLKTPPATHL